MKVLHEPTLIIQRLNHIHFGGGVVVLNTDIAAGGLNVDETFVARWL